MLLFLIILGICVLYWKSMHNSMWLIDDIVPRQGYLYIVPEQSPPPSFYSTKRHWIHGALLLFIHSINVWIAYTLFGWEVAALFAFSPLSVPCCAWATGGYYAVTTLFTLTSYFFIVNYPSFIGAVIATIFFTASLGSTITCLGFPFLFLFFNHLGLVLFFPTIMYLTGKRFKKGYAIRDMGKQDAFGFHKIPVMTKVVAYYIYMCVFPLRLAFFRKFGEDYVKDPDVKKDIEAVDKWFWISLATIIVFMLVGWQFSPLGVMWFLVTIAPFTQFKVLGQFVAERYVYLPAIGWYLILGSALAGTPLLFVVLALYIIRSHFYIPAYASIEALYESGIKNEPNCLANYANLGERYIHTDRLAEGRDVLSQGIALSPQNFLCYTNMAAYWIQVRDITKGLYYTEKSIEFGKSKSSWYIVHAMRQQQASLLDFERKFNHEVFWKKASVSDAIQKEMSGKGLKWEHGPG